MNHPKRERTKAGQRRPKRRAARIALLLCLAILIQLAPAGNLRLAGTALAEGTGVLHCTAEPKSGEGYAGFFVHSHNEDCYDGEGSLVCELEEITEHTHDESCFDGDGNLTCGKEEIRLHTHTDGCWETDTEGNRRLTCGKLEIREHVHGEECFRESASQAGTAAGQSGEARDDEAQDGAPENGEDEPQVFFLFGDDGEETEDGEEIGNETGESEEPGGHMDGPVFITLFPIEEDGDDSAPAVGVIGGRPDDAGTGSEPGNEDLNAGEEGTGEEENDGPVFFFLFPENETEESETEESETEAANGTEPAPAEESETEPAEENETEETGTAAGSEETAGTEPAEEPLTDAEAEADGSTGPESGETGDETQAPDENAEADQPDEGEDAEDGTDEGEELAEAGETEEGEKPADEEPVTVPMPAQTFTGATEDIEVYVEADEGAFPEGTTMVVTAVTDDETLAAVAEAAEADEESEGVVTAVVAVDITFLDANGKQIEPLIPIRVSMRSVVISESDSVSLVHLPDAEPSGTTEAVETGETEEKEAGDESDGREESDGRDGSGEPVPAAAPVNPETVPAEAPKPEIIEAALVPAGDGAETASDEIVFESDAFSVYGLVGKTIEKKVLASDGLTYRISVTYGADAKIPAGAELSVEEILPGTEEYLACMQMADETIEDEMVSFARFFDITIVSAEGEEIQPAAPVEVQIELAEELDDTAKAIHFGEEVEVIDSAVVSPSGSAGTETPEETDPDSIRSEVTFSAEGFSIYGILLTTLEKTIMASDGNTYAIHVTYGPEAKIPVGAMLTVREILPDGSEAVSAGSETGLPAGGTDSSGTEAVFSQPEDQSTEAEPNPAVEPNPAIESGPSSEPGLTGGETVESEAAEYDEYLEKTLEALGEASGVFGYARFFDITILDGNGGSVQPAGGTTVDVRIELADAESEELNVVHFGKEGAEVLETAQSAGEAGCELSFEAVSFSVYAIVDAPSPVMPTGWTMLTALEEIAEKGEDGLYILHRDGYYFKGETYTVGGGPRTGIQKTAKTNDPIADGAVRYFFEQQADGENRYKICCLNGTEKTYIVQSGNSLNLTTDESAATVFTCGVHPSDSASFNFLGGNSGFYINMQGGAGGSGFAAYNSAGDANARIRLAYYNRMEDDPYSLDGTTYGIAFHDDTVTAGALTAESKTVTVNKEGQSRLAAKDMLMRPDVLDNEGVLLVAENSDIQEWTFQSIAEDRYYITTEVPDETTGEATTTKYLTVRGNHVTLEDEPDEMYSVITATPGTGTYSGKWHFTVNGYSLNLPDGSGNGFNAVTGSGATTWMNLVKKSILTESDFHLYSAQKVSVSDPVNVLHGQQVVLYTRVWNDTAKKYEFYVVNHDGTLARSYDTGDNIEWFGTQVNTALWEFREGKNSDGTLSYYYWLQNTQYGNYIRPKVTGGQVSYTSPAGTGATDFDASVNLNGRRYGETFTTVIAWDDENYSYSGLKAENGRVAACPLSEAEDFYFAVINPVDPDDTLTTVTTVDNDDYGITMRMIDFNNEIKSERDSVQHAFFGSHGNNYEPGLLSTDLDEATGYPSTTALTGSAGRSLGNLFTGMTTVNQLFIQSVYNESGYFEYDSTQNFATLRDESGNLTNTFTVYDQLAAIGASTGPTRTHGQFMPYNTITAGSYAYDGNGNRITNQTDVLAHELSDVDPRKGEKLYSIVQSDADYYFGMEMSAGFTQTASGLDAWGHDIIFEFSGDDDFWLYVDGELILDLGGVRSAMTGSVNFRTGTVTSSGNITLVTASGTVSKKSYTLREVFESNYRTRNPGASESDVAAFLAKYFEKGSTIFRDYTNHTMNMFYMERGAGASNLHMRFNLAAVKQGAFHLSKKLSGAELEDSSLIEFPYQIWYYTEADGETEAHLLGAEAGEADLVRYEGSARTLNAAGKYRASFTPAQGTEAYENVFLLKPGETAEVTLPEGAVSYYVVECGVNPDIYDKVSANGTELTGTGTGNAVGDAIRRDYATATGRLFDRAEVEFDNHVSEGAMRTLRITKRLYDTDGQTLLSYPDNSTLFTFRLYLGDENTPAGSIPLADFYSYYILDPGGSYCRWDATQQQFVSLGITEYDDLVQYFEDSGWTPAQRETVIFNTSMNGSISKVPAGYTVEVRGLILGTRYMVEERAWEIPRGYTLREGDGYTRVDVSPNDSNRDENGVSQPYSDTIRKDEDPRIEIRNQKGWGLTVEKVWTDQDFMETHDDIYFAVYVGRELYDGSVRRLKSPETEIYYYFEDLIYRDSLHTFSDFVIREVTLTGDAITADEEGKVTGYDTVTPIPDGGTLTVGGRPAGGEYRDEYSYAVSYTVGESTGHNENVRTDTVTNSRPGILLYKTNWTGGWADGVLTGALAGAAFTLTDSEGKNVAAASYTSGSDGLITIAYLNDGTYTLTETAAPGGYVAPEGPLTVTVATTDGRTTVIISSTDENCYRLDTLEDNAMAAVITVRNRTTELLAKKVDAKEPETALAGVHFALYRQVTDINGNLRRDYLPMAGYEDIVTNEDGVLPAVTAALGAGTYYLAESQTLSGYVRLSEDLCFTLGSDGTVTVLNGAETGAAVARTVDAESGQATYVLTIPNYRMGIMLRKTDQQGKALPGAVFSLQVWSGDESGNENESPGWADVPENSEIDMTNTAFVTLSDLVDGRYRLTETTAPEGYVIPESSVFFTLNNGTVQLTKEDGSTPADGETAVLSTETDQDKNTVYVITIANSPIPGKNASFVKTDAQDTAKKLAGAVFHLYSVVEQEDGKPTRTVIYADLTSDENGLLTWHLGTEDELTVFPLEPGTYELEEKTAPDGYNMLPAPVTVTVTTEGVSAKNPYSGNALDVIRSTADTAETVVSYTVTVPNAAGSEMPETGGAGMELFTLLGVILSLTAGAILTLRKKNTA